LQFIVISFCTEHTRGDMILVQTHIHSKVGSFIFIVKYTVQSCYTVNLDINALVVTMANWYSMPIILAVLRD